MLLVETMRASARLFTVLALPLISGKADLPAMRFPFFVYVTRAPARDLTESLGLESDSSVNGAHTFLSPHQNELTRPRFNRGKLSRAKRVLLQQQGTVLVARPHRAM